MAVQGGVCWDEVTLSLIVSFPLGMALCSMRCDLVGWFSSLISWLYGPACAFLHVHVSVRGCVRA